jgi:putative PIN family toxin of toxin-antitoxin system
MIIKNRPRLVLDTNICLDLFVFHDSRWSSLLTGLREKKLEAVTKTSCRNEWLTVLHYPQLPVTDANRPGIIQSFDDLIPCIDIGYSSTIKLPICSDSDDQQFMELARDAQATHLITKDKALLKCARKVAQSRLFHILTPEAFVRSVHF